ncbi:MAG: N-acetylglucosamine-6-phosphate deacetylase [Planctomycetes bacterium]|nr:N-acetylglucosamine-6-phosphate deacetylase [Planctomycetota bacterium]
MSYPGPFVDLQINGYAGVDFNADDLRPDDFDRACAALEAHHVQSFFPTIITDAPDRMAARLARLVDLRDRSPIAQKLVPGLHIEGPFLNPAPGFIGAHPAQHAQPANLDTIKRLLESARGLAKLVTLAPECDPNLTVTRYLASHNIRIAAGHTDASLDQLRAAIDAGLSIFTHLGNGCPAQLPRHDNIIQRVLHLADRLYITLIADGHHLPTFVLENFLRMIPPDRAIIVTDAIAAASLGPGRYTLASQSVQIDDDGVPRSPDRSHFIGSAATMPRMAHLLATQLHLPDERIRQLMHTNPRAALAL